MHRYLVFAGEDYYPGGGWRDFQGSHDFLQTAMDWCDAQWKNSICRWAHIVDSEEPHPIYHIRYKSDSDWHEHNRWTCGHHPVPRNERSLAERAAELAGEPPP